MLSALTPRRLFLLSALFIAALFGYALKTQYVDGLEPCPLCMTQRGFYVLAFLFALLGALHAGGRRPWAALMAASALGGAGVAGRQVWLQHLPADQVPACGPSLEFMLQRYPFSDVLVRLFTGDGNCAEVDWSLLGLSMAEWSLLCFLGLAAVGLWQLLRRA
jgi:disulfide bond formation protein DsbB